MMKYLNLILFILIVSSCPINLVHAFFDKDIRLLTMQDGLADNTITPIYIDDDVFIVKEMMEEVPNEFYEKREEGENDSHLCETDSKR